MRGNESKRKREGGNGGNQSTRVEDFILNSFKLPSFLSSPRSPSPSPSLSSSSSRSQSHSKFISWPPEEWFRPTPRRHSTTEDRPSPSTGDSRLDGRSVVVPPTQSAIALDDHVHQPPLFSTIIQLSPSNTQSINPTETHPDSAPVNPDSPSANPNPALNHNILPPNQPSPLRPPPLHPSILAQKNGGTIPIKETMDAHSSFSEYGQKQVNQYLIKTEIGRGSFGTVHLAEDAETGLSYAIKEFSKTRLKRKYARELKQLNRSFEQTNDGLFLIRNEVAIMKKIRHQNVVKLHEVLDVVGEDSLYMVMEYCPGGSLMQLVKETHHENQNQFQSGLEIDVVRKYFRQLIVGIDYLHRNEIIHYDIKPDNILLSSDRKQIKVADFGISAMFTRPGDDSHVSRTVGSPAFLSPEIIKSEQDGAVSGTATDIWAMGVTLYFILTGRLPFPSGEIMEMYDAIENKAPPIPDEWDTTLIDLMVKLFDKDPSSRMKMAELKIHPWVTLSGKLPRLTSSDDLNESTSDRISRFHITDHDLKECFRFGITNHCPSTKSLFFELVENSRKHCHKPGRAHRGRRRELFFKEFHRQISERNKL